MTTGVSPLSARLAAVASAIEPGGRVADIGTDHGKLPLWLAAHSRVSFCLATEKREDLLARAARPPSGSPWASRVAYRAGDGLDAILSANRVDTVVMAGIGGRSIVRMLSRAREPVESVIRLVLQPRSETPRVRRFLAGAGWHLCSETLTEEAGRFHVTLGADRRAGGDLYAHPLLDPEALLAVGPLLLRSGDPLVERYWRLARERFAAIVRRRPATPAAAAALDRAERILEAISRRAG